MSNPDNAYIQWLVDQSMLHAARQSARLYAGQSRLWQRPYAQARPRDASAIASVWFTAYPAAIITADGASVLQTLGDERLWSALSELGVQGIHNGPMKRSGGLRGREYTPTVDGNFDRIGFDIDPALGSEEQMLQLSRVAAAHNAVVIDDIVPAHTGKGADFRLAELAHEDYPGLYHMVEIREEDWSLLPEVPPERDAVNLLPPVVDRLKEKHYIVGQLQRVIFFEPGIKDTDWSATGEITGVDGKVRRWVYLHYFKEGQPSLNWLDPTFAAQQLIIGDALHAIDVGGARVLRLDANGFLGVERRAEGSAWSESHPLSVTGNQLIAGMIRKAGGFSFQELNLTLDDIAAMSHGGADLSYDFITRPAYQHALLTGDSEFLRLMLKEMHTIGIDPASLIHALQNHDELTLELVMFNAMQPGVFALSGWDLVGALPLAPEQVAHLMGDGDTRWINRGAYDLADLAPEAQTSAEGLPRARALYGSLVEQLQNPGSFACQLKRILSVRRAYDIAASRQILIPEVQAPGLLVMVHELPAGKGVQLTALNFGAVPISETICLPGVAPGPVVDIIHERVEGDLTENCELTLNLDPYEGLALRVVSAASPVI